MNGLRLPRRLLPLGLTALAACSVLPQPKYVQQTQWPLIVHRPQSLPRAARGKVLVVRDVQAAPGVDQRGLQWFEPNGSVHVDFYNQWAVTPSQAATSNLQQWLTASGLFSAVVGGGSGLIPNLILDTQLTQFIADPRNLTAHCAILVTLINADRTPSTVLLQQTIAGEARMPVDTPEGVADGLRAALADALGKSEAAIAQYAR